MQSAALLTAIPIGVLCVMSMASAVKYLRKDFGDMSTEQIIRAGKDPGFVARSVLEEQGAQQAVKGD